MNIGLVEDCDRLPQQAGTPRELYETPSNVFVAGFIGSPAMKFFEARIEQEGEALWLASDGMRLPLPRGKFQAQTGARVSVGLRPEVIFDPAFPRAEVEPALLDTTVDLVEPTGSDTYLHVNAGSNRLVARVDPRTAARPGGRLTLACDLRHLHLFDPETELALGARTGGT